ncbi:MAG: hypothetical protein IH988_04215 [Planctomycetes bacterium]|nr:hypothetical protein [Planctomycetota bacterium]
MRATVVYQVACSSIGCPGREALIAAALHRRHSRFLDNAQNWRYNLANPDWIAWSSVREHGYGATRAKWQVTVADHNLAVRGVVAGFWLSVLPPADTDGDGSCEVVKDIGPPPDDAQQDIVWWVVLRIGDEHNEIVWVGLLDESIWTSRRIRLSPIWRDEDGDGRDEFVFVTVEATRTAKGGIAFKPPRTVAVFEWDEAGGILLPKQLPNDAGITLWTPPNGKSVQVEQDTDLEPLVRELLPVVEPEPAKS